MQARMFGRGRRFDNVAHAQQAELPLDLTRWTIVMVVTGLAVPVGLGAALLFVDLLQGSNAQSFFSGIPDTLARTVVVVLAAIAPLMAFVYSIWRFRLERMAWRDGTVDVAPFVHTPNGHAMKRPVAELTALFQTHLSRARLANTAAVPTAGGSDEFITVVENAGDAAKGPWRAASRFVRLLFPQAAYQVIGSVLPGDADNPCVLSVALTKLPKWSAAPQLIREATWERAVEHAAHAIAAQILPRTQACRRPPWRTWLGRRLPAELFDAYQRAETMQQERRYDEAMRLLHLALRQDPTNVWLRLDIAQLQEQLDLRLDALLSYADLITLLERNDQRAERSALLVARYRYAVLLGLGDKLADQWWNRREVCNNTLHWTARERQREHLRLALRGRLIDRHDPSRRVTTGDGQWSAGELLHTSPSTLDESERAHRLCALRVLLTQLGQEELERLEANYRHRRRPRRELNKILPQRAIRVTVVWAHLRRAMALRAARQPVCAVPGQSDPYRLPGLRAMFSGNTWPPSVSDLQAVINHGLNRRKPKAWQEHYSAACAYAVALLSVDTGTTTLAADAADHQEISRLAITELTKAETCSEGGFLAQGWLLYEEPDLEQLRSTQEFRDYATATFALRRPIPSSPSNIHIWEQASYVAALITAASDAMEKLWHHRASNVSAALDVHDLEGWWRQEIEAWRFAYEIGVDHRDWPTRAAILTLVQDWFQRQQGAEVVIDYPKYTETYLIRQYTNLVGRAPTLGAQTRADAVEHWASAVIEACDSRLSALSWAIHNGDRKIPGNVRDVCLPCLNKPRVMQRELQLWADLIADADVRGTTITPERLRRLCLRSAERWRRLGAWFNDHGRYSHGAYRRGKEFAESMSKPIDRTVTLRHTVRSAWHRDGNVSPWW